MTRERRFLSVGVKLALGTVVVLTAVSIVLALRLIDRERVSLVTTKRTAATMIVELFATGLSAPVDFGDAEAMDAEVKRLAPNPDVDYAAVWLTGAPRPAAELSRKKDATHAAPQGAGVTVFDDRVEAVRPVLGRSGNVLGQAVVSFSLAAENAAYAEARGRILLLTALLALGTAGTLLFLVRQIIVAPLGALAEAARRMERGTGRERVVVRANDEIGRLGEAFNAMSAAIRDREERVAQANRKLADVLDNMGQAIVVFGPGGVIEGAPSRACKRVFGSGELEGRKIADLLYPGARPSDAEARAFAEWLSIAFAVTDEAWPEVAALGPSEVELATGTVLTIELRRIPSETDVPRVMLVATDVTDQRRLEQTVARKDQDHARQMAAMRRLIAGGGHVFVTFLEGAEERLARVDVALSRAGAGTDDAISPAFQDIHTVKGEARAFGLDDLAVQADAVEETLSRALGSAREGKPRDLAQLSTEIGGHLEKARAALARGRELFVEASPIGRAALEQVTVQRSDVEQLVTATRGAGVPSALHRVALRLAARPFGEATARLVDAVPAWAEQAGKALSVVVEGKETLVPSTLAPHVLSILTQLARNSIAHGIEPRAIREEAGKDARGTLRFACFEEGDEVLIVVADDGAGLDEAALLKSASAAGLDVASAAEAAFSSGVSTRTEADLSGRGMGLGAVRAAAERAGYRVLVTSERGRGTTVTLRPV